MDKNKNRTDLLAAGRKKLQQYRQKKDGKGGKSSGKSNKSDRDVASDESSSVAKSSKGKKQLSDSDPPVQDSATELIDSSSQPSNDNVVVTNADVATPDLSSTPDLPIEVSEADDVATEASVPVEHPENSETVNIEEKHESEYVHVTAVDDVDRKEGEVNAASGEDQVPDVGAIQEQDNSRTESDNQTSSIDLERDTNPTSSTPDETSQDNLVDVEKDTTIESTTSATEQTTKERDESAATNSDMHSASELPFSDTDPPIQPKEDFHGVEGIKLPPGEEDIPVSTAHMESVPAEFSERLKEQLYVNNLEKELNYLKLCEESDVRKEFDQHRLQWDNEKSAFSASIDDVEGKNRILSEELALCRSELDRVTSEMENIQMKFSFSKTEVDQSSERIQELQSELVDSRSLLSDLQAKNETLNVNVSSLTEEKSNLEKEKGDVVLENENLMKELTECKSLLESLQVEKVNSKESLDIVIEEKNKLEKEKQDVVLEYDNLMKELTECKTLLESLQVEKVNVKESHDNVIEEKNKLEKEKRDVVLENENLMKELTECKSLLELSQVQKVKVEESFALVTQERAKLEDEKQNYVSDMENLLSNLVELKKSVEELEVDNSKLNELLASEREEKSKLKEENEHFINENKKFSLEFSESQTLVESLRSEITNLRESLNLVTNEKIQLGEETNHLSDELTNCKSSMQDLQAEYEKSMNELKNGALQIEKLTEENVTLVTTIDMYKAKITEIDNSKMKSEPRAFLGKLPIEDNSQQLLIFFEHMIMNEVLKQHVHTVEAKKGELVSLCEELKQDRIITKTKNTELTEKLYNSESRINELQVQADNTASFKEIHEDVLKNHNVLSDYYKDLEGRNELAAFVIHKVFDNLQKLVNDSGPTTGENVENTPSEQLDHLEISNYDVIIERLTIMLRERHLEFVQKIKEMEEINKKLINPNVISKLLDDIHDVEIKPDDPVSSLELIIENLKSKETKLIELEEKINHLNFSIASNEVERSVFKESLKAAMEQVDNIQSETRLKETELNQSEQRVSALREKLHIAVTKGKGLIQQRDGLKQNLTATSTELEKCRHELQLKETALQETETKLRSYSEAGERMEALESELSYIRNSATALRESFLLKDSVLQRIEEILEDLDLPEDFHVRDIIDKIDWLAKSVSFSQNSFPTGSNPIERSRSYPESRSDVIDGSGPIDDELRRNYEELQNRFYGLAEHNEMLEQSLMERNNLVQRWEEILDKINFPPQLRSLEPEDRIEWLTNAYSEVNERCDSLQRDVYDFEKVREELLADLEESRKRLGDLEAALQLVTDDYNKLSEKAGLYEAENDNLQNEVGGLRLKLEEKRVDEENVRRLRDLVKEMVQDSEIEDFDSSLNDVEYLEQLVRKLGENYTKHTERSVDQSNTLGEFDLVVLERKVEEIEGELVRVKEERDTHVEKSQSLVNEVEELDFKNQELQKLVAQEKQNSVTVQEELNVSVRKVEETEGELVAVKAERDRHVEKSESLVNEIETLNLKIQELQKLVAREEQKSAVVLEKFNAAVQKVEEIEGELALVKDERDQSFEKIQSMVQEIEASDLKNQELQKLVTQEEQKVAAVREKLNIAVRKGKSLVQQRDGMKQTITELTSQVEQLTSEVKLRENTILEHQQKMKDLVTSQETIEEKDSQIQFLKNHITESDTELQENRNTLNMIFNSLAEIDLGVEFQTNDPIEKLKQISKVISDLQVSVSSAEQDSRKSKRAAELLLAEVNEVQERNDDLLEEISELSKKRDSAEAAKRETISRLERLSALYSEERNSQFSELMTLKARLDQLKPGFGRIYNLVNDVLPKNLDYLYNLEASAKSLLESSDTSRGGIRSRSESKVNVHFNSETEEIDNDVDIIDLWRFVGTHMQDLITDFSTLEEKLQTLSKSLHEEVTSLSKTMSNLHKETTSDKHSLESAKEEISWLQSTTKQKETENSFLRKHISTLYEACKSSVFEIEKSKGEMVSNDSSGDILSEDNLSDSEERILNMVNKLLSLIKDFHSVQTENVEVNLKEMKATISSLQNELTEKDVQKDRMCVDLVSQIKRAESAAMSHLQELEAAKAQINDLKGHVEAVNVERDELEQKVKELESQESVVVELNEKVKSLTSALTAKEQEAEALLQALDEEEAQMEDLTNKITELERLIQQKDMDLETTEAARGKALKKLSITVSKFDELHHLSETLVSEVDNLQSQLQERDSEISFLRDEITRCTSDSLLALESDKRGLNEFQDILTWLDSKISGTEANDLNLDENKSDQIHEYKENFKKQITSIISELKDLRQISQSKDDLLRIERSKVEDLMRSLQEKENRLSLHENEDENSTRATSMTSEIVEVEPLINKWASKGNKSMAAQVRSLRKVNNDQLAISIDDVDSDEKDKLEDEDDDKAHGFKSLTTSKLVPKFTRPVTNFVDGLWVTCDRALMRQPVLRLSLILYWALMHALLATFVV